MARGHADFGATAPRELTSPLLDSGELEARLGSPDVYDRLGTVLALYTADQPVAVQGVFATVAGRADNWIASSPFGPYVWRLTVSADGDRSGATFRIPYIGDTPAAVEVIWRDVLSTSTIMEVVMQPDDGTTRTTCTIRWDGATNQWQFLNSSNVFTDTPTQADDPSGGAWNSLKVNAHPDDQTYGRAVANGVDLGVTGTAAVNIATQGRNLRCLSTAEGTVAAVRPIEVAAVIITVNEL